MKNQNEIFIKSTLAYCTLCKKTESARIVVRENGVFMERLCPAHGIKSTIIASDHTWYMERVIKPQTITKSNSTKKSELGCPNDCGLCEWHSASIHLPVFSITNDCNMDCPICFTYNRTDKKYYKDVADTEKIIDSIMENAEDIQLINMTGGEPTLHPELFDIIDVVVKKGINRITLNTNGIKIAEDIEFAKRIKESGVHLVFSLDTFDPDKSITIHGIDVVEQKKRALEVLESLNIPTTILSVCIKDVNEKDVSHITKEYIKKDFVRSITIQNMTFTGKNGKDFQPRGHITIDEIENLLAENEEFSQKDFFQMGSYHPLCYSVAYYIKHEHTIYPLTKVIDSEELSKFTRDSYFLDPNKDFSKEFYNGINRLWAEGEDENNLRIFRTILKKFYPTDKEISREERNKLAEEIVKMIYIHPHMDEDNFDIDRVSRCGDLVPDESGKMVPACSYNLLYRQLDERFWKD